MIRPLYLPLLAALAVQGCATQPTTTAANDPTDPMNDGRATTCTASPVANGAATISMSNDGWCSVALSDGGAPFAYPLLRTRAANGIVKVQPVGRDSRIEYTPTNRFAGTDSFTVALRSRTAGAPDVPVQVAVNVAGGAATPVSAPAVTPPAATTARRPAARPAARAATPAARRPATR